MGVVVDQDEIKRIKQMRRIGRTPDMLLDFQPYRVGEEREPKGFLMKALDYLNRGNYAVANFVNSLFVEKEGIGEAMSDAWKGLKGEQRMFFSDVLENAGVRNRYIRAIAGFVLDAALDPINWLTFGVGQGTKLGFTTLSKAGKEMFEETMKKQFSKYYAKHLAEVGSKKLAKELARESIEELVLKKAFKHPEKYIAKPALRILGKKVPILSNVTTASLKKLGKGKAMIARTRPMKWIGEAFIGDEFIIKHAKDLTPLQKNLLALYRQHYFRRIKFGQAQAQEFFEQVVKKIPKVADREKIMRAIEKRQISKLPKYLQKPARELRDWLRENVTAPEMRAGILKRFRGKKFEYVPHYPLEKLLGKVKGAPIIGISKSGKIRYFETLEQLAKAGFTPVEDAAVAFSIRYAYSQNLLALDDYIQKMINTVGIKVNKKTFNQLMKGAKQLPEGYAAFMPRAITRFYPLYFSKKPLSQQKLIRKAIDVLDKLENIRDWSKGEVLKMVHSTSLGKALKITEDLPAYLIPKEIADMLNASSPLLVKEINPFKEFVQKVTGYWKVSVTAWFPAFHARNATSNLWLCYLAGMGPKDVLRFKDAWKVQTYGFLKRLGKDPEDFVIKIGKKSYKASELYELARQTDVLSGWYMRELGETYEKQLLRKAGKKGALAKRLTREVLMEKPRAVGSAVENNARLALFLHRLAKGDDIHSAARTVKKFLFDYGELTRFEKETMRSVIPFYTWLRKNIPLEVEQLVMQPGKFAKIKKMQHAVESLSPTPDERYLPDWMQERELFVRIPREREGNPLYINPDLAFQDLAYLNLKDPDVIRSWLANLHPAIKIPFETLTNYSLFRGRNIVDPDLPGDVKFVETFKQELLDSLRIWGYKKRLSREDVNMVHKILDVVLGIKSYPYDEIKSRYWYFQRKKREQRALRNYYKRKAEERLKKRKLYPFPYEEYR